MPRSAASSSSIQDPLSHGCSSSVCLSGWIWEDISLGDPMWTGHPEAFPFQGKGFKIPKNVTQVAPEALVHPCLLQHYSQKPSYGNNQDAPLLTNGSRKCGIYTQWNEAMKKNKILSFTSKWMEPENIILSEVSLAQKTKNCMFSLICGH
jgi:hypothetical protein